MLNTTKNALVRQNLLVVQLCCGYDEFAIEFGTLSITRSCTKTYDCNMIGIQQDNSNTVAVAAELEIPLVDIMK